MNKKRMRKGTFSRAGWCAALSSFRVGKCCFCRKRACFLQSLQKVAEVTKRVGILIYYTGKGYFLTGHSEKGYQFQNVEHTV